MKVPAVILCVFAAIWGAFGMSFAGIQLPWLALPPAVSVALLIWVLPKVHAAGWPIAPNTRRIVALWSTVEIAAMVLAVMLLRRTGHVDAIAPVLAMIVGAHMFPIARSLNIRFEYWTGFALIAAGIAALAFEGAERSVFAGLASAAILWVSAGWIGYLAHAGKRP